MFESRVDYARRLTYSVAGASDGPGGVAQLVERHVRNVEVGGSSPLTSTRKAQVRGLQYCSDGEMTFRRDLI